MRKTYDTWGDANQVKAFVADFKQVKKGSVFVAVVKDDASRLLTVDAKKVFEKMGSEEIQNLGSREGFGFVGVVGTKVFGEQRGAKIRSAMTLSYSKAVKEKVRKPAKVEGASRFEVHSAGKYDHGEGNFYKILINNEEVRPCDKGCRGLNVVAVDPFTHKVILSKNYDTFAKAEDSERFLKDVKPLPVGAVILVGV